MKLFRSLKIWIVVILLCAPLFSLAQYKFEIKPFFTYFRDACRWEIAGNYMLTQGTFNGVVPIYGHNNLYITDSTLKRSIMSEPGFGGSIGVTVPFAATGHISLFAFTIHAMVNQYKWTDLNITKNIDQSAKIPKSRLNATSMQVGIPIGIDYKIGCDAIESKRLKFCAAFGAGVLPHLTFTALDSVVAAIQPEENIGFNPYLKLEVGVFMGWCIKLRAMYTMGNVELMNSGATINPYTDGPFKLTTNSHAIFSLVLMPFSHKFRETAWFNDYDSYNWNEKLN